MFSSGGLSRPLLGVCRAATPRLEQMVYEPRGTSNLLSPHARASAIPAASPRMCVCSQAAHLNDESACTYRSGRQAVVSAGRR
jgi:hypothetical protein